jgi:Arc/MetJ family transcription regulator
MAAIEIPDETLQRAMRAAHTDSPQVAVAIALDEYTKSHDQASLIKHLGTFEDMDTPDEFQRMREMD